MIKYLCLILILGAIACSNEKSKPDVSGIKVNVSIERFEQDFFKLDTNNLGAGLNVLAQKYPLFLPVFLQHIIQVNPADSATLPVLNTIISGYRPINDSIQKKYVSMGWLKDELEQGFKYVRHYYPTYKLPRVITFIGTLDAPGAILTQDYLGIGLHQFGGKNFSVYGDAGVQQMYPYYISRRFDKEYMAAGALKAIADDLYADISTGLPLIEQMVEKGKQWYLLDRILPDAPDSIKTGYTQRQLEWLADNEANAWVQLTKAENIYSIEPHVIQTYIGEAPFTQGMTESSPGNIGQWLGWRIVEKYAQANGGADLQTLLQTPAREIFEGSSYRPK